MISGLPSNSNVAEDNVVVTHQTREALFVFFAETQRLENVNRHLQ
jgi:hypothetical protein